MKKIRLANELAEAVANWGWKYHHAGIPTTLKMPDEKYIPHFNFYISGFGNSPFGIEWMRFEPDCPFPELIQTVPHIAFEVQNMESELANRDLNVIVPPNYSAQGIRVAMIEHNGAPIELIEFEENK